MKVAFCSDYPTPFYEALLTSVKTRLAGEQGLELMEWEGKIRFPLAAAHYLKPDAILVGGHATPEIQGVGPDTTIIGFSNAFERTPFPRVVNDDREIGRLAARAIVDAGYEGLVVFVDNDLQHAHLRVQGMRDVANEMGWPLHRLSLSLRKSKVNETFQDVWREHAFSLEMTLKSLKPNTGIIATSALSGSEVLEMLQEFAFFDIPGEMGLLLADYPQATESHLAHVELDTGGIAARIVDLLKQRQALPGCALPEISLHTPVSVVPGDTMRVPKAEATTA